MADKFFIPIEIDPAQATAGVKKVTDSLKKAQDSAKKFERFVKQANDELARQASAKRAIDANKKAVDSTVRSLQGEIKVLRLVKAGHKDAADALRIENQLRARGVKVTAEQRQQLQILATQRNVALQKTEKGLQKVNKEASKTATLMKRAFAVVGIALLVRETLRLADSFTVLQNKLKVVTTGSEELASATDRVFKIAQETRSDVEAVATSFSRIARATEDMGTTQEEAFRFTERLSKAIKLSGATAQEAQAGMIQLSQGLASGALRGDEMRSVLEQLPVVAKTIADSMGVTIGQLRILGSEGKVTAQVVLDAFEEAGASIDARFGKTVPTIAETFQLLRNEFIRFVGESSGEITQLVKSLVDLAIALKPLAGIILDVSTATAGLVGKAADGWTNLANVLKTSLGDDDAKKALLQLGGSGEGQAGHIKALESEHRKLRLTIFEIGDLARDVDRARLKALDMEIKASKKAIVDREASIATTMANRQAQFEQNLGDIGQLWAIINGDVVGVYEEGAQRGIDILRGFVDIGREAGETMAGGFLSNSVIRLLIKAVVDPTVDTPGPTRRGRRRAKPKQPDFFKPFAEEAEKIIERQQEISSIIEAVELQAELLRLTDNEREIRVAILGLRQRDLGASKGQEEALIASIRNRQKVEAEIAAEKKAADDAARERAEALQQAAERAAEAQKKAAAERERAQEEIRNGVDSLVDGIVDLTQTGAESFREMTEGWIRDLLKVMAKMLLMKLITAAFGGDGSAIEGVDQSASSLGGAAKKAGLKGFATGGSFNVGGAGGQDSQFVAFRATPGERVDITPQGAGGGAGGSMGGGNVKVVNVNNQRDAMVEALSSGEGERVILNVVGRNRSIIQRLAGR